VEVSGFQDFAGRLIEKFPSFFLKMGKIESSWFEDGLRGIQIDRPIYIAGLARSGSTILLEILASHSEVATHQYRDFPFVHMPIWWNRFLNRASQKNPPAVERAHQDRIMISPSSPEAMEEILWMAFFPRSHDPAVSAIFDHEERRPDFEEFYRDHIRKMLFIRKGTRYVSKGNYNISRLEYLHHLFPDARFIIPVRDPVSQIASLMKQRRLFCEVEKRDPRVLSYMQRSGHFEFGLDQRPINFGSGETTARIEKLWREGHEVRGWAVSWSSAYSYIASLYENNKSLAGRMLIVPYGELCRQPAVVLRKIYNHCELDVKDETLQKQAGRISAPDYYKSDVSDNDLEIISKETRKTLEGINFLAKGKV